MTARILVVVVALGLAGPIDIEQRAHGTRPPPAIVASFDGLGGRNPSDNSLAVGPHHVVQTVNSRIAIFTKTGEMIYGPLNTNSIFKGFGGACERINNGDTVVRYDQLAGRWLIVMPIFRKLDPPHAPYAICYAVSKTADPLGAYHRYEFPRTLFPDYPRPAVWPDGYYTPTSTGDDVIQKHVCVAEREKMLSGEPATEQCVIVDGANFLNTADLDGRALPPAGAPNIVMAAGGTQLKNVLEGDGIDVWQYHVDWKNAGKSALMGPKRIAVAPYRYLCGGQLTNCVPQPGSDRRLDAQGDKIMPRLVYRRLNGPSTSSGPARAESRGGHESIVAVHSVNTMSGGGVRWYEFRVGGNRDVSLYQQGTFAPDAFYRWMASPAMDRFGNIGIGYSFGGTPHFAGQRFAARLANDPKGQLTLREAVLVEGEAAQSVMRWEDYTQTAIDPVDDCTIWYVGDYVKKDSPNYISRIGAFRLPGCASP